MIVVIAAIEGWVNHERACQLTSKHSKDANLTYSYPDGVEQNKIRDKNVSFISELLDRPFSDDLDVLGVEFCAFLEAMAAPSKEHRRFDTEVMKELLLRLCDGHYLSGSVMEILLGRKAQSIRQNYLKPMVDAKQLKLAFPNKPNSPK